MHSIQCRLGRRSLPAILSVLALLVAWAAIWPVAAQEPDAPKAAPHGAAAQVEKPAAEAQQPTAGAPKPAAPAAGAGMPPAQSISIVYLSKKYQEPLPLSYAEPIITDKGIQGARLGITEGTQAGTFVGHAFELEEAIIPEDGDIRR